MASRWKLVLAVACCMAAAGCERSPSLSKLTDDGVLAKAGLESYWQLPLQLLPGDRIEKLTLMEENLYCLTSSNWLIAIDAASGQRKWQQKIADKGVRVYPICHGSNVAIDPNYVGVKKVENLVAPELLPKHDIVLANTPDYVLAIDRKTGKVLRNIRFDDYLTTNFVANTGGACDGTFFYVGTATGGVRAIRVNEGVLSWSYSCGKIIAASPQVWTPTGVSPRIYVASEEGDLTVLKAGHTASTLWPIPGTKRWPEMQGGVVAQFHVDDRAAFIPCLNQRVYAFGLAGGEPLWWFTAKGPLYDNVQVSQSSVFQYARGDKLYDIDPSNGKSRWSMRQGRRVLATMPVSGAPTVYIVDNARNLLVVDEILGKIRVTIPLTGATLFADNTSAPAIFIGDRSGNLVCLRQIDAEHLTADMLKSKAGS